MTTHKQNTMRKWLRQSCARPFSHSFLLLSLLLLMACGVDSGVFRIEGEFKGFNQGELYVYSTDGGLRKLDTIAIKNGRFRYQIELDTTATFVLVFPNFSELPVFGGSGVKAEIEGDASHLKEIEVKGTKTNELMTAFRLRTSQMTPPETLSEAAKFIKENPHSEASVYLLNKLFLQSITPDYRQASELAAVIQEAWPENKKIALLAEKLKGMSGLKKGNKLPKFTATDINGRPTSSADLYSTVNVITTWATWNYESMNIQRQLKRLEKEHGNKKIKIVSFCIDASTKECKKTMERDSITWTNVCDGKMWETRALTQLGLGRVPDNIITDSQGKIIDHGLNANELKEKIEKLIQ